MEFLRRNQKELRILGLVLFIVIFIGLIVLSKHVPLLEQGMLWVAIFCSFLLVMMFFAGFIFTLIHHIQELKENKFNLFKEDVFGTGLLKLLAGVLTLVFSVLFVTALESKFPQYISVNVYEEFLRKIAFFFLAEPVIYLGFIVLVILNQVVFSPIKKIIQNERTLEKSN